MIEPDLKSFVCRVLGSFHFKVLFTHKSLKNFKNLFHVLRRIVLFFIVIMTVSGFLKSSSNAVIQPIR